MKFRTDISLEASKLQISHQTPVVSMGSCFADSMGKRLGLAKVPTTVNPLGIAYNPLSISRLLQLAMEPDQLPEAQYSEQARMWHSFDLHSSFNHPEKEVFIQRMQTAFQRTHTALREAKVLMLTFGTAMVWRRFDNHDVVTNCHKYPAAFFNRDLLEPNLISDALYKLVKQIQGFNPDLQILLTVSPVRHIKDTIKMNSVSKAILRLECHRAELSFPNVHYFPAFEIMMDDLRDYRFYQDDLIHPTEFAQNYIWEKFLDCHVDSHTLDLMERWQLISRDFNHRPIHPESEGHLRFLKKLKSRLDRVKNDIDCEQEIKIVEQKIADFA
ncbi:GSCFA domain-containing protein [Pontibacter sp. G13]|uniref:GSCFA domain-containing protein n=1 Tax=Pontibacter sp. G13 TaxID=3074898 RepID=UPI00288927CB|nr:GSCFA domain-containing protein [Pontibacter sp. G13]WNJ21090.1 GSCFA domain-containing protein [Pontibacter sp. G13]